jgi:hypothetical protein
VLFTRINKTCGAVELELHSLLILVLGGVLWSALYCGCFTPRESAQGKNFQQEPTVPRDGADSLVKKNNLMSLPALEPRFLGHLACSSGVPRNFVRGGGQQIQLSTEDRENGDLGAVAP